MSSLVNRALEVMNKGGSWKQVTFKNQYNQLDSKWSLFDNKGNIVKGFSNETFYKTEGKDFKNINAKKLESAIFDHFMNLKDLHPKRKKALRIIERRLYKKLDLMLKL